jgi:hypothetical protein
LGFRNSGHLDEAGSSGLAILMIEQLGTHWVEIVLFQEDHEVLLIHTEAQVGEEHDLALGVRAALRELRLGAWLGVEASATVVVSVEVIVICLLPWPLIVVSVASVVTTISWLSPV